MFFLVCYEYFYFVILAVGTSSVLAKENLITKAESDIYLKNFQERAKKHSIRIESGSRQTDRQ
jgi:hypothetical protein